MKEIKKKRFDRYLGIFIEYSEYVSSFKKKRKERIKLAPMKIFKVGQDYIDRVKQKIKDRGSKETLYRKWEY